MSYDDIHLIFKKYFNLNVAFLEKTKEQMEEEDNRALKRKTESSKEKVVKKQKLDEEVEELKKHLQIVPNDDDDDDVYAEATPLALKMLWKFVKERFASSKLKNFLDDFLLTTLTYMFEKPDVQAQIWKNQSKCSWFSKGQKLEIVKVLWSSHHKLYNHSDDLAGREKIPINKVHFRSDDEQSLELMLLKTSKIYTKGLRLLVEDLLLPIHVDAIERYC
nr:hypothetical protein [Tanacetum cinerariifolium]